MDVLNESDFGVYAQPRKRRVLHSEVVEFRMSELRRRKPKIVCFDDFLSYNDVSKKPVNCDCQPQ